MPYYPQFTIGEAYSTNPKSEPTSIYNKHHRVPTVNDGFRYPQTIVSFDNERGEHPTQKPVALYEYLIKTYTQTNEIVLDFCCGSGTTALAAKNLNRNFIVGDQSEEYCAIARHRLAQPFTPQFPQLLQAEAVKLETMALFED